MTRSEKKFRARMEKQLSFNQGARIKDRRDPVEINPDDESLADCDFVGQGVSVPPSEFAETEPEIYEEHDNEIDVIANSVIAALKGKQNHLSA